MRLPHSQPLMSSRSGAAALEFAIVSLPFFGLLLGLVSVILNLYLQFALDYALQQAVRQVQLGLLPAATTAAAFTGSTFCPIFVAFAPCSGILVSIQPVADYTVPVIIAATSPGGILHRSAGPTHVCTGCLSSARAEQHLLYNGNHRWAGNERKLHRLRSSFRERESVRRLHHRCVRMLKLLQARRGLAGVEFAIIVPLLLTLLCGVVDLSRAILLSRRLTLAASYTATIASTMAVQASNLNALSGQQAWQASTAPFAVFPNWLSPPIPGSFSITLSSVVFVASSESYTAHVAWSVANPSGQTRLRSCGTLTSVPDSASISLDTLPVDTFGPTSILVADVSGVFTPAFTSVFVSPFTLQRSDFVSPRINNGVVLTGSFPGPVITCAPSS